MGEKDYGYKAVVWLSAKVLLDRGFASDAQKIGAETLARECPLGNDLAPDQAKTFNATARFVPTRFAVWLWWLAYRFGRWLGAIPPVDATVEAPWRP